MTFVARDITVQIQLDGDTFDQGGDTLELKNIRCRATIQSTIGGATPLQSAIHLQLWGMTPSDMAKLSTLGFTSGLYKKNRIIVLAGDAVNGMTEVFNGGIFSAFVDYNAMPDVGVEIEGSVMLPLQLPRIDGSSQKGSVSVATMLQAIAANCSPPLTLVNNGVSTVLANHAVGGTAEFQIANICQAAMCNYDIINGQLSIWPMGALRDDVTITVSSDNGLVGYPMYSAQGIDIVTEFNPQIMFGRKINVLSSIPKPGASNPPIPGMPGTFYVFDVVHDLSSQLPNGPWFTKAKIGSIPAAHAS
jgi:hypothetical protein